MARLAKGNVFEDLGFSREEAADLAMKVDLARFTGELRGRRSIFRTATMPGAGSMDAGRPSDLARGW
jgi:hypothetical protein